MWLHITGPRPSWQSHHWLDVLPRFRPPPNQSRPQVFCPPAPLSPALGRRNARQRVMHGKFVNIHGILRHPVEKKSIKLHVWKMWDREGYYLASEPNILIIAGDHGIGKIRVILLTKGRREKLIQLRTHHTFEIELKHNTTENLLSNYGYKVYTAYLQQILL